jgi:kynurenine 3-monooxygenase
MLARRGCQVDVYEQYPDPRVLGRSTGRSINLTLCTRGFVALDRAGVGDAVREKVVPVRGRVLHRPEEPPAFLPYGARAEALSAIARNLLWAVLLDEAERVLGARFHFGQRCTALDLAALRVELTDTATSRCSTHDNAVIIGADGAFSTVRLRLQQQYHFNYSQEYSSSSYVELPIVPSGINGWTSCSDALHLWPRQNSMLLAIPNSDRTFTGSLLLPSRGPFSHETMTTGSELLEFMRERFPDAVNYIPSLADTYFSARPIPLVTVRCSPWSYRGRVLLLGDAAHAIFPAYGQGANAGFEDCTILDECFEICCGEWEAICPLFEERRKRHTDVIAELSKQHLSDLQDAMGAQDFALRSRIETRLSEIFAGTYRSLYAMIAFTSIPYADALRLDASRKGLIEELLSLPQVREAFDEPETEQLIKSVALRYGVTATG